MSAQEVPTASASDVQAAQYLAKACHQLQEELGKVIVGQKLVIEELLIAILARGHCLMQGVPGLAKTLLISTVAQAIDLSFRRIQFTPDLMPSDITGTDILQEDAETGRRRFEFQRGPIFANLLLADEINRTPPKTQAALLEAMNERTVTVEKTRYRLREPFLVLATQNPVEYLGTYPLPESQLDRFLLRISLGYPGREEELGRAVGKVYVVDGAAERIGGSGEYGVLMATGSGAGGGSPRQRGCPSGSGDSGGSAGWGGRCDRRRATSRREPSRAVTSEESGRLGRGCPPAVEARPRAVPEGAGRVLLRVQIAHL